MADTDTTPEWLKLGDGFADITLARPLDVAGTKVSTVRMREPTVADQLVMDATKGGEARQEITLFANLTDMTPADIEKLTLKSMRRLQEAYLGFLV